MTVAFAKYVPHVLCFTYVVLLSFHSTQSWEGCLILPFRSLGTREGRWLVWGLMDLVLKSLSSFHHSVGSHVTATTAPRPERTFPALLGSEICNNEAEQYYKRVCPGWEWVVPMLTSLPAALSPSLPSCHSSCGIWAFHELDVSKALSCSQSPEYCRLGTISSLLPSSCLGSLGRPPACPEGPQVWPGWPGMPPLLPHL